ncbi:MAG: hypothetical protein K5745_02570 [Saccharofermentans sp.]|nr:hypothetical protein [Saccharofermentans sp.]
MNGRAVIEYLAGIYQQLYLAPGEEGAALYPDIVKKGKPAPAKSLEHFKCTPQDELVLESTPAGEVTVITLCDRGDFETFLQIIGEKCQKTEIPKTQGAVIFDGVINHVKIKEHEQAFYRKAKEEGRAVTFFDYLDARKEFLSDKRNYTDALIVLSKGPYSAVPGEKAGMEEDEWILKSDAIRRYHECTHFVCRRLYRELIDKIYDEIVADAVGLYAAFGKYDTDLAGLLLGVSPEGYKEGRLINYVGSNEDIDAVARDVYKKILEIADIVGKNDFASPYDLAIYMEEVKKEKQA